MCICSKILELDVELEALKKENDNLKEECSNLNDRQSKLNICCAVMFEILIIVIHFITLQ